MKDIDDKDTDIPLEDLVVASTTEKHYPSVNKEAVDHRRKVEEQLERKKRIDEYMDVPDLPIL